MEYTVELTLKFVIQAIKDAVKAEIKMTPVYPNPRAG
jgi:hypothetical protein